MAIIRQQEQFGLRKFKAHKIGAGFVALPLTIKNEKYE